MNKKKAKNAKCGKKLRIQKPESEKIYEKVGRFMKVLEEKVHFRELEVCNMSSRFKIIMN